MKNTTANDSRSRWIRPIVSFVSLSLIGLASLFSACEEKRPGAVFNVSAEELEERFGQIIEVANIPTPAQHGTGDKMGLFQDKEDTFWGVPVSVGPGQSLVGCAPPDLEKISVSDTLPSDTVEIVGATNEPTSWRAGTGALKLLVRTSQNRLRWQTVKSVTLETDSPCWSTADPVRALGFYRLVIADKEDGSSQNTNSQNN